MTKPEFIVGSPHNGARGSKVYPCTECGARVNIAPSGQRRIRREKLKPLCLKCVQRLMEETEYELQMPSTADIISDLMGVTEN